MPDRPLPDRAALDADRLRAALPTGWARVEVVDRIGSTNAALLADGAAPDRSLLVAEEQDAGRGRLDRAWASPPRAGLLFSLLVRPSAAVTSWGWLPLLTGVALHDAVGSAAGVAVALKWPNDLLAADDRKLAGILVQSLGDSVVVGIGLNVSTTREELPVDTATSLALCGAAATDRTALLASLVSAWETWFARWTDAAGDAVACGLHAAYVERCATLGREVEVSTIDGGRVRGTAAGVDEHGRLRIDANGTIRVIGAGDVHHLRRPGGTA